LALAALALVLFGAYDSYTEIILIKGCNFFMYFVTGSVSTAERRSRSTWSGPGPRYLSYNAQKTDDSQGISNLYFIAIS